VMVGTIDGLLFSVMIGFTIDGLFFCDGRINRWFVIFCDGRYNGWFVIFCDGRNN
jgi:hypothetical protein